MTLLAKLTKLVNRLKPVIACVDDISIIMLAFKNTLADKMWTKIVDSNGFIVKPVTKDLVIEIVQKYLPKNSEWKPLIHLWWDSFLDIAMLDSNEYRKAENVSIYYLFWTFLKIGSTAFGGFMALVSVVENIIVERRELLHYEDMLDGISLASVLPGPVAES